MKAIFDDNKMAPWRGTAPGAGVLGKLDNLIRLNASRYDFLDCFQKMIEAHHSGALSIEQLFAELVTFTKDLNDEQQRHLRENISEEELAVFDILTQPGPDLTPQETEAIK